MEVVEFNGYTPIEKFKIAKNHLIPNMIEEIGLQDKITISDSAIKLLINNYTMESGVRGLKKVINKLGREVAVELNKEEKQVIDITAKTVDNYLDMKPIHHDRINEIKKPGIVTGLAWTSAGGDILFIETLFTKGKGNVIITGQLGDVMKESVSIAISLVKALFPTKAKLFSENDLHIHVPEGAVPKDGPSAGITLTTALASLVMNKPVDNKTAMTGEVSLRGVVMPIGGLPEKLMAAERSGIKTVYIPKQNLEDLKDVPDEVKQKLEIIPVSNVNEVLKLTKITKE
jgi:ATP-dependent Lon protease